MKHDKTHEREVELDLDLDPDLHKHDDQNDLDIRNDELGEPSRRTFVDEQQQPLRLEVAGRNGENEDSRGNRRSPEESSKEASNEPVAWRDLPRRHQLIIITLARLSEPLVQTSLQVKKKEEEKNYPSRSEGVVNPEADAEQKSNRRICSTNSSRLTLHSQIRPFPTKLASSTPASWPPNSSRP